MSNGAEDMALKNGRWQRTAMLIALGGALGSGPTGLWFAGRSTTNDRLATLQEQVKELHTWHSVTDPATGIKVWYRQRSLQDAIERHAIAIASQTEVMRDLSTAQMEVLRSLTDEIKDLRRDVRVRNGP
jgi:hypothetical protein